MSQVTFEDKVTGDDLTASNVNQLKAATNSKQDAEGGKGLSANDFTTLEKAKLSALSTDAVNRARANHTGTQAISTIFGLQAALDALGGTPDTYEVTLDTDATTITLPHTPLGTVKVTRNGSRLSSALFSVDGADVEFTIALADEDTIIIDYTY